MEVGSSLDYLKFLIIHEGCAPYATRLFSLRYSVFLLLFFVLSNREAIKSPQHRITAVEYPGKTLFST